MSQTCKLNSHCTPESENLEVYKLIPETRRNLTYIYLCCAETALKVSNVPIFKVLQHYLLTENGEFKVLLTYFMEQSTS